MHRDNEKAKYVQKLQLVVKDPDHTAPVCVGIVQFIAMEFIRGSLEMADFKKRRDELTNHHHKSGLVTYLEGLVSDQEPPYGVRPESDWLDNLKTKCEVSVSPELLAHVEALGSTS